MNFFNISKILLILQIIYAVSTAQIQLEVAFPDLSFTRPVDFQIADDGSNRIFVVEQSGMIRVFENNFQSADPTIFLDIRDQVDSGGNEEGLLGLAFHPGYTANGYFYVNYTAASPNRTVISRFKVSDADPNIAEADSEQIILEFSQPHSNHNGGQIAFGPDDGYLYIATGDGGSFGDPECNAQNLQTLLGAILRIDVNNPSGNRNYGIPPDNPFKDNSSGYREEIYAYGLRNPWRFSFDPETNRLWTGDVGQNEWEEIDIIIKGGNYGWNIYEGLHCYSSGWSCDTLACDTAGLEMPVWEYPHSVGDSFVGSSVTGGYIYRGSQIPELQGKYVYGDFVSGRIWTLEYNSPSSVVNEELLNTNLGIASFGIDQNKELYLCAFDGKIYRFKSTATSISSEPEQIPENFITVQNYPNPFNPSTRIEYSLISAAQVAITVYDAQGRRIRSLFEGSQSAGLHTVSWDGTNAEGIPQASGNYFVHFTVGQRKSKVHQIVLIR